MRAIFVIATFCVLVSTVLCSSRRIFYKQPRKLVGAGVEIRQPKSLGMDYQPQRFLGDGQLGLQAANSEELRSNQFQGLNNIPNSNYGQIKMSKYPFQTKYVGYHCPMGANSIGDGMAIIQADPYDCSKYYYCVWGVERVSECSNGLLWNDKAKTCDWYWNVKCDTYSRRSL